MFIPYRVDVPFNHRPFMNWAAVAGVILVFSIQIPDLRAYSKESGTIRVDPNDESKFVYEAPELSGITGRWLLDGWGIKGLFGHMWLHGGILHLVGNLIFLWLFGNAVCSKIGNVMERDETSLFKLLGLEKDDRPGATDSRGDLTYWQQGWREEGIKQVVHGPETTAKDGVNVQAPLKSLGDFAGDAPIDEPRFIRFTCRCGQNVKVPGKYAGLTGRCPSCSTRVKIPSGRGNSG